MAKYRAMAPNARAVVCPVQGLAVGESAKIKVLAGTEKTSGNKMTRNYLNAWAAAEGKTFSAKKIEKIYLLVTRTS